VSFTAVYAFAGESEGDLAFDIGDKITITKTEMDLGEAWMTARNEGNGKTGSVPFNYLEMDE
jgi:hypothetical protein